MRASDSKSIRLTLAAQRRRLAPQLAITACLLAGAAVLLPPASAAPPAVSATPTSTAAGTAAAHFGIGSPATDAQIAGWNIDVFPDGRNLPAGSGTVAQGRDIYNAQCLACHGAKGEGGIGDVLVGGEGTLNTKKPIKTVGSYWPYATTLYDYIRRSMPMTAPQSLTNDQVYAVTGYVLFLNKLAAQDATMDAKAVTAIKMPNRDGFVPDPRPDVKNPGCMQDCTPSQLTADRSKTK